MTAPARSLLVWRCTHCHAEETEPHELAEAELRAALDAGRMRSTRLHYGFGHVAVSVVVALRPTLIGMLERLGA